MFGQQFCWSWKNSLYLRSVPEQRNRDWNYCSLHRNSVLCSAPKTVCQILLKNVDQCLKKNSNWCLFCLQKKCDKIKWTEQHHQSVRSVLDLCVTLQFLHQCYVQLNRFHTVSTYISLRILFVTILFFVLFLDQIYNRWRCFQNLQKVFLLLFSSTWRTI